MKTMNEEQQAANSREVYEAPKCEIIEMQNEGDILVGSGYNATHGGFEDSDEEVIW